jgi:hypothetical protein
MKTKTKTPQAAAPNVESECAFSPVENELPLRWYRRLHLVPANGLGVVRRAMFLALLTWLPIVIWAATAGRLVTAEAGEPLLQHFGIHVRCLLAIPLLILAEAAMDKTARRLLPQFLSSGVVGPDLRSQFEQVSIDLRRLRDSSLPWVPVFGVALAWSLVDQPDLHTDAMSWALDADQKLGFGGWWFGYVVRPIFLALVLSWLWRLLLVVHWFWRVSRLELSLVPTHPDRTGGLGFVEKLPGAFAMVTFALSATIASRWAHEIAYHGQSLDAYKLPAAAFVVIWTLCLLMPLLALIPVLAKARARAIPAYAALVGEQGRLVHRRWILRQPVADAPILDAPEIGPVADAAAMYEAVTKMRVAPIGKASLIKILVPMALPMLVVAALQIPFKELLLKLLKALV